LLEKKITGKFLEEFFMLKQDRMLTSFLNGLTKLMEKRRNGKITEDKFFEEYDKLSQRAGVGKLAQLPKNTAKTRLRDTGKSAEERQREQASFSPRSTYRKKTI
jgi:hypothetical protein